MLNPATLLVVLLISTPAVPDDAAAGPEEIAKARAHAQRLAWLKDFEDVTSGRISVLRQKSTGMTCRFDPDRPGRILLVGGDSHGPEGPGYRCEADRGVWQETVSVRDDWERSGARGQANVAADREMLDGFRAIEPPAWFAEPTRKSGDQVRWLVSSDGARLVRIVVRVRRGSAYKVRTEFSAKTGPPPGMILSIEQAFAPVAWR